MAAELLPCPMCGLSEARIATEHDSDGHRYLYVRCPCGLRTAAQWSDEPCPLTYAEVRERWNRRAPAPELAKGESNDD